MILMKLETTLLWGCDLATFCRTLPSILRGFLSAKNGDSMSMKILSQKINISEFHFY